MKKYTIFLLPTLLLLLTNCSDDSNGTDPIVEPKTVSHDFDWEVKSLPDLSVFFSHGTFYGTTSTNVYLAGYTASTTEQAWRWNGSEWATVDLLEDIEGGIIDIDGIDSTFVFFLGLRSDESESSDNMVINDNGVARRVLSPTGNFTRRRVQVVSRNEIYITGKDAVQKYNGTNWELVFDTSRLSMSHGIWGWDIFDFRKHPDGDMELITYNAYNDTFHLWKIDGDELIQIDSYNRKETPVDNIQFGTTFYQTENTTLSYSDFGIFERKNKVWGKIYSESAHSISGSVGNLFLNGRHSLLHYNGSTWKNLYPELKSTFPEISVVSEVCYVGGELFVLALGNGNSKVI